MALTDRYQEELTKDTEERLEAKQRITGPQQMPVIAKIILIALLGFALYMLLQFDQNTKLAIIIVVCTFAILLLNPASTGRKMLQEQEVVNLAYKHLLWKQQHPIAGDTQISPNTQIRVSIKGNLVWKEWGGEPFFWEHLITLISSDGYDKAYYVIKQDPYTDLCYGIYECPEGYMGRENPPRIIVMGSDLKKDMFVRQKLESTKNRL